ncbi:hypothetical protein ACN38_g4510 [Penicillium nordicum]|uniref:Uncharacterized protein n=1 Tax=Penicillium nordicum TaxID=229535 RepID=A0A0M9WH18_9EURO|nr:hypothetical protein ACN38_g4510 [Penicillium nordicum]
MMSLNTSHIHLTTFCWGGDLSGDPLIILFFFLFSLPAFCDSNTTLYSKIHLSLLSLASLILCPLSVPVPIDSCRFI